jgi:hypothetical protein
MRTFPTFWTFPASENVTKEGAKGESQDPKQSNLLLTPTYVKVRLYNAIVYKIQYTAQKAPTPIKHVSIIFTSTPQKASNYSNHK